MLSYRHQHHAGNDADVIKHVALCVLLGALTRKDKPLLYLETHGGAGRYALEPGSTARPAEFEAGIAQLRLPEAAPGSSAPGVEGAAVITDPEYAADSGASNDPIARYLQLVRTFNAGSRLRRYPGSPWFAQQHLRPGDRALVAELHPQDFPLLAAEFRDDPRFRVLHQDGYALLKSELPPAERRALVFIDPAYERRDEVTQLTQALQHGLKRFAHGVYAVWYPIGGKHPADRITAAIRRIAPAKAVDLCWRRAEPHRRANGDPGLQGCGLVVLNPPYLATRRLAENLRRVAALLEGPTAGWQVDVHWLTGTDDAAGSR